MNEDTGLMAIKSIIENDDYNVKIRNKGKIIKKKF